MAWRDHSAYPDASCMGLAPWGGAGILTGFPFGMLQLGHALGPANPRLTNIAVEPLAPPVVGILTRLHCYFHRDPRPYAVHWSSRPSFYPRTAPPLPDLLSERPRIGGRLSPVHFRGTQPRRVSCYALFKGWLPLSQPPRCLRLRTPFVL